MQYKLMERNATAMGVTERVVSWHNDKEGALNALNSLFESHKDNRRYVVTKTDETFRMVLKEQPMFATLYLIQEEN